MRAELVKIADSLGDRGAVKDLVNRSYDDWERGGSIARTPPTWWPWRPSSAATTTGRTPTPPSATPCGPTPAARGQPRVGRAVPGEARRRQRPGLLSRRAGPRSRQPRRPGRAWPGRCWSRVGRQRAADRALQAALAVNPRHTARAGPAGRDRAGRRGLAGGERRWWPPSAAPTRAIPQAAWLAAGPGPAARRSPGLRGRARSAAGDAPRRRRLLRLRRRGAGAPPPLRRGPAVAADGVERDGDQRPLLSSLGNTLLRLGDEDEGLALLRRAWERDPYDVRTYNLLNLFEKVIAARYVHGDHRALPLPRRGAPRARPSRRWWRRSWRRPTTATSPATASRPPGPIVFELYAAPEHYAVRTVGLPRLGVAGVCFGRVITSQSPTNGAFNWGMVLAHELAHVFALQLSRSRVPRWFTEGLAELETARCAASGGGTPTSSWGPRFGAGRAAAAGRTVAGVRRRAATAGRRRWPTCTPRRRWSSSSGASASPTSARRWWPTGAASAGAGVLEPLAGMPRGRAGRAPCASDLGERLAIPAAAVPARDAARYGEPAAGGEPAAAPARLAEAGLRSWPRATGGRRRRALARARAPGRGGEDDRWSTSWPARSGAGAATTPSGRAASCWPLQAAGACRATTSRCGWGWPAVRLRDGARRRWPTSGPRSSWPPAASRPRLLAELLRDLGKEAERLARGDRAARAWSRRPPPWPSRWCWARPAPGGRPGGRAGRGWRSSSIPPTPICTPPWAGPWPRRTNPARPPAPSNRRCSSARPTRARCTARWRELYDKLGDPRKAALAPPPGRPATKRR